MLTLLSVSAGLPNAAPAENWPSWRGPTRNGVCTETDIRVEWSREKNVAWRLPLPGPAGATPVIWDDRIFLTSVDGAALLLLCIDTKGKELWRRTVAQGNRNARNDEGNSAAPSPVTDGRHVWSYMANGVIACYDFEGDEIWKFNLQDRYGKFSIAFGLTSTPVLHDGRLFFQLIHGEGNPDTREAKVVAIDAATGEAVWEQPRPSDAIRECEHSYASPTLYDDGKLTYLITHGADYTVAHRLSDGSEIWRCGNLNVKSNYNPTLRFVASPVTAPGIIVIPTAKGGPVLGMRPNGKGDVTDSRSVHLWRGTKTPDVPSPLIHDGLVYLCMQDGNLKCLDAKTGREHYFERTHRTRHRASPVYADDHLYLTARDGKITVVKAGPKFEIVAQNDLGEDQSASPAISDGTLYLRTFKSLWAIK